MIVEIDSQIKIEDPKYPRWCSAMDGGLAIKWFPASVCQGLPLI